MCAAVAVPWILILLHFAPLSKIISSVAQAPGTRQGWLDGRLKVISATVIPLGWGQDTVLDAVFLFLSNCVLGVTLALILTRTLRRPRGPLAWSMIGGVVAGLVLIPTANATSGLYDTGFPAVVMLFVLCVAACPAGRWKALTAVGLTLAAATWATSGSRLHSLPRRTGTWPSKCMSTSSSSRESRPSPGWLCFP